MQNKQDKMIMTWDWKDQPDLKQLEAIGVYVYDDPACEGSDCMGYIFSTKKMTKEEVKKYSDEQNG